MAVGVWSGGGGGLEGWWWRFEGVVVEVWSGGYVVLEL